jgi:pyruvate,water dikinase
MDIVWLGQGDCRDCALVGGKGANLCHLAANYRIPLAFCLTAAAFTRWSAEIGPERGMLPPELYTQLVESYRHLAERCGVAEPGVAVRSSALDEDGQAASFAGQYKTYLNVIGAEAIAQAVIGCWASARSAQVLAYRRQQGLIADPSPIAVLIQQLIPADISAVAFSLNPITGNRDEVVINASWGLGESIVSGTVTPDTYIVRKADLAVISSHPATKRQMTVLGPGGTRQAPTPRFLQTQSALNHDQVVEITRLALSLEATMGWPVDVECAYHGQELYLLQCRPVTRSGQGEE